MNLSLRVLLSTRSRGRGQPPGLSADNCFPCRKTTPADFVENPPLQRLCCGESYAIVNF